MLRTPEHRLNFAHAFSSSGSYSCRKSGGSWSGAGRYALDSVAFPIEVIGPPTVVVTVIGCDFGAKSIIIWTKDSVASFSACRTDSWARFELLLNLVTSVTSSLDIREVLRAIAANKREVIHADAVGVSLLDPTSGKSRLFAVDFPHGKDVLKGCESNAVPDRTTSETRMFKHGRGIYLMKVLVDEVSFEESGTVVHVRKESSVSPDAESKAA